jgi:hypothetical protein
MSRPSRWVATIVAFGLASVINPGYFAGCASDSSEGPGPEPGKEKFAFGEAEMLSLVDEANATGPFDVMDGTQRYRLEVLFAQRDGEDQDDSTALRRASPLSIRAYACGTRTFMQSAAACITSSQVLLAATLNVYRIDAAGETQVVKDQSFEARLTVYGTKLSNAELSIGQFETSPSTRLMLSSADGKSFKLTLFSTISTDVIIQVK